MKNMRNVKKDKPDWLKLELLVANIQRKLAPDATIEHNVKMHGINSGVDRQVDVLMRQKVGQYEMVIVIDAKDYKIKVDVKGVEEFRGLVKDVGAHKGVLVSPMGFTPAAHKIAEHYQIELYRPVDPGDHKWRTKALIPVVFDFREASIILRISGSHPGPLSIPINIQEIEVLSDQNERLGSVGNAANEFQKSDDLPMEPGDYLRIPLFPNHTTMIDDGHGGLAPVIFTTDVTVVSKRYYGALPLRNISGFLDDKTGKVITNAFDVGLIAPETVENEWQLLNDGELPPVQPVFTLTGLVGYFS